MKSILFLSFFLVGSFCMANDVVGNLFGNSCLEKEYLVTFKEKANLSFIDGAKFIGLLPSKASVENARDSRLGYMLTIGNICKEELVNSLEALELKSEIQVEENSAVGG